MKKILSIMLVTICILFCSCTSTNDKKTTFLSPDVVEGYKLANYETYDSPAKENGLGGTKIYIDGTFKRISDDAAIYAMLDDGEHNWSIVFGHEQEWTLDDVKRFEGQRVRVFGVYTGFSAKFNVPTVFCIKFTLTETGECHYNMEFSKTFKPSFEAFEDALIENNKKQQETNQSMASEKSQIAESAKDAQYTEKLIFELIAGKPGKYGKMITYNKGTEFEESFYAFYVPVGTYTVTNVGKNVSQINVYSNEIIKNENGWDEPSEAFFAKILNVNEFATITISEDQHIEIAEPSNFMFEQQ